MFALVSANLINASPTGCSSTASSACPRLGVAGSAWATFAARIYMCGVLGASHGGRRTGPDVGRATGGIGPNRAGDDATAAAVTGPALETRTSIRRLVELGLPAASTVTAEVGVFAVATALAGRLEPVATASHQIALNIAAVAFMIPLGLASAGAVRVGNAVGARNPRGAAAAGWTVIAMGVAFMLFSGALFVAVPRSLIGLFTTDAAVLALGSLAAVDCRGVPAVRRPAGRRHGHAPRARRHPHADGHQPRGALADRAARSATGSASGWGGAHPACGGAFRPA